MVFKLINGGSCEIVGVIYQTDAVDDSELSYWDYEGKRD
jgi:hypothetical protein